MIPMDILPEVNSAIKLMFGLDAPFSQYIVYGLIIIILVSWLAVAGYLLSKKPRFLDNWKYPTLSNITIILLVGVSSYIVAFMVAFAITLLNTLETKQIQTPPFLITLIFMVLYIVLALNKSKSTNVKETGSVPKELVAFIPQSFRLAFLFFFINLFLYYTLGALGIITIQIYSSLHPIRKWIGVGSLLIALIFVFIALYHPKTMGYITNKITTWTKNHKVWTCIIVLIFLILMWLLGKLPKNA
jgi:type III secretory pathway component EscS